MKRNLITKDPSKTSNCSTATHRSEVKHPKSFQIEETIFWNCYWYTWAATPSRRRTSKDNISKEEGEDNALLLEVGAGEDPEEVLFVVPFLLRSLQELTLALRPHLLGSSNAWVTLTWNALMRLVSFNSAHRHAFSLVYTSTSGVQHVLGGFPVVFKEAWHGMIAFTHWSSPLDSAPFAEPQILNRTTTIIPKYTPLLLMIPDKKQK